MADTKPEPIKPEAESPVTRPTKPKK